MKTLSISSMALAATAALAQPVKRAGGFEAVTFNSLYVDVSDTICNFAFSFDDPNTNLTDNRVNLKWTRPSEPPADTWTNDNNYIVSFPEGVDDITHLTFTVKNANSPERINVATNNEAADSAWTCSPTKFTNECHSVRSVKISPVLSS
ncbi:hypothetical protein N7468_000541 [Penicillium chermesinum]|uniref:Uncharacterized protein n=1 Tax=Penicillium chermesinum TaxID=63820 RepID=A0A9W9PKH0_9EURO|nr:uncharacterized protein N7468_000541 [Penicillium chermesinum]KAJ5249090.1 hypothetical protein N7468_000541 [Penicillium chermesinum]